ncbi:MAG TPA: hypothetical protein VF384_11115 [Planctomycetota bacterium]
MKIHCSCGFMIHDGTDDLPQKGHLIPDRSWFATHDAIDGEIIEPLAAGWLEKDAAHQLVRHIMSRSVRLMWQCRDCGRLYIDGLDGQLRCFVPDGKAVDREILRGGPSRPTNTPGGDS